MTRSMTVLAFSCTLVFACMGPKGDPGPEGPPGAQGAVGATGPQGPPGPTRFVNMKVIDDSTRVSISGAASIVLESFLFDKKSPTSFLLIEGAIAGKNSNSGSMQQGWKLGAGTEVLAQSITYTSFSYSVVVPTRAVITGHTTTGPQIMTFRFFTADGSTGNTPFTVYNPNATDDPRLGQTHSVYTIWEFEP